MAKDNLRESLLFTCIRAGEAYGGTSSSRLEFSSLMLMMTGLMLSFAAA